MSDDKPGDAGTIPKYPFAFDCQHVRFRGQPRSSCINPETDAQLSRDTPVGALEGGKLKGMKRDDRRNG